MLDFLFTAGDLTPEISRLQRERKAKKTLFLFYLK